MADNDYLMTIDSDNEETNPPRTSVEGTADDDLNPEFTFDLSVDNYTEILGQQRDSEDVIRRGTKPVCMIIFFSISVSHDL